MAPAVKIRKLLADHLKELHLPAMRQRFEAEARRAEKETLSYEQYLLELAQAECAERQANWIDRLLRQSRIPLEKNLTNFDLKRLPAKVSRQFQTLLDGTFLDRRENVLVFGATGSGKTHALCALGQELIRRSSRKALLCKCSLLVQELLVAKRDLKLPLVLKRLNRFEALIIVLAAAAM